MLPSCAADYGGDGTELELGSFGVAVDIDDKYPLWRCQLTRMTLVRRLYHFFDWVAVFAAKFDETDDSSKPDIISFLRILDDAGSSKMLDAHSSMNVQIKRYGDVQCSYHSGNAPSDAQEGASSAARGVADDVAQDEYQNAASASSASVHSMNTSTVCPEDEPLQGCHINIVEDAPPCPAASASSASSANRPKSKRRYGVANARKLSGSGQKWIRGTPF